jgi:hypothetical protein
VSQKTLSQIVAEKPFLDYAEWWPMGPEFLSFMAEAIVSEWTALAQNKKGLEQVQTIAAEYLATVYNREARPSLVDDFVQQRFSPPLQSGEFDALSYAFFRSAFELLEQNTAAYAHPLEAATSGLPTHSVGAYPTVGTQATQAGSTSRERRLFTKRVGRIFFSRLQAHLKLDLPEGLADEQAFAQLQAALDQVGAFLQMQGYLRDHFAFYFEVTTAHAGRRIEQTQADFLADLQQNGRAYALYEMGYPAILPSAVYLFQTIGEAQHHSSRTIEELFERVGYEARETDDFDPTGYPSNRVVELWEIRKMGS